MKGVLLFVKASDADGEKPSAELLGLLDYPELTDGHGMNGTHSCNVQLSSEGVCQVCMGSERVGTG